MTNERRLANQRRTVHRLTRELAFELAVLQRLEKRERGAGADDPRPADIAAVYAAALLRARRA